MNKSSILESSTLGYKPVLDIFSTPMTDVGVSASQYTIFYPINSVKGSNQPVSFSIYSPNDYLEPASAFLYLQLAIKTEAGEAIGTTANVSFMHDVGAGLWESVQCNINGQPFIKSSPLLSYMTYIQDMLYLNSPFEKHKRKLALWYPDSKADTFTTANENREIRKALSAGSKTVEIFSRINNPLFFLNKKLIPPDTSISLEFRRSLPEFILDGVDTRTTPTAKFPYRVDILRVELHIRKFTLNPLIAKHHSQLLAAGHRCTYPLRHNDLRLIQLPSGTIQHQSETIYQGKLPLFFILTLTETARISGSIAKNGFIFQHHNLESVILNGEGGGISISRKIDLDISSGQCALAYHGIANLFSKFGSKLTIEDMKQNNCYLGFELTPDISPKLLHQPFTGQITLFLKFKEATTQSLTALLFAEYENILQIGKNQEVFFLE